MEMVAAKSVCSDHTEFCVRLARIEEKLEVILGWIEKRERLDEKSESRALEAQKLGLAKVGLLVSISGIISGVIVKLL